MTHHPLTPRQRDFIHGLAQGLTLSQIAARHYVCRSTVVLDLRAAARTAGMRNPHAAALVDHAYRTGLLTVPADADRRPVRLSGRRAELLPLLAAGLSVEEIAGRMGVGVFTVRTHLRRLYLALGARSRAHAVALGYGMGLLDGGRVSVGAA